MGGEQSKARTLELNCLRAASRVARLDRMRNEDVLCERSEMVERSRSVNCGMMTWVKWNALRWHGNVRRTLENKMVKYIRVA